MEHKKRKGLSSLALLCSVLPLATFIPIRLKMTLPDGVRTVWGGANIVCVLLGLILSIVCVKSSDGRSAVNIGSMAISALWILLIVGMLVLALFLNILQ
ncbi:MAG: hypothetical protein Q4B70_09080 [Lachnospiraceae bacterium]|nr:hypothetical protein [Lachnospiraceae bacterium]